MSWNPLKEPVDYAIIAGKRTPGICDIVGASSPRKWDERDGYGLSGATLWFKGVGLAHFSIKLRLYTDQDWEDWYAFKPLVERPPLGKWPKSKDIHHPLLVDLGIKSIVIEDLLQAERTDDSGEWTQEIKAIEFRTPKFTLAKPDGSAATPADPVEQEIGRLTDQYQSLAEQ